jgi:hypothetical protein
MFIAPEGMAKNIFEGMRNIPEMFVKYGHFILCVVALGLTITMYQVINGYSLISGKGRDPARPEFSQNFKTYFFYLMATLGGIVLLYLLPLGILPLLHYILKTGTGTLYEHAMNVTSTGVPALTFALVFISIMVTILAIIGLNNALDKTSTESGIFYYSPLVYFLCFVIFFIVFAIQGIDSEQFFIRTSIFSTICYVIALISVFATKTKPNFNSTNISLITILSSMYTLLFVGLSIYALIINNIIRNKTGAPTMWDTLNGINSTIMLSVIEIFNLIKGGLIAVALFMLGFTVKEYSKMDKTSKKYTMYNNKFRFDALFITLVFLLLGVLLTSFLNTDNLQSLIIILVEYMSPVLLLVVSALLISYTNHLAQLSRRHVLNGIENPEL